jgi:hypothetical protein
MSETDRRPHLRGLADRFALPVFDPIRDGVGGVVDRLEVGT